MLENTMMSANRRRVKNALSLQGALLASTMLFTLPTTALAQVITEPGAVYNRDTVLDTSSVSLTVGGSSEAGLTIIDGINVSKDYVFIGQGAPGRIIVGAGSQLTSSEGLEVGIRNAGNLLILDNSHVKAKDSFIGMSNGGNGEILVRGEDSTFVNSGSLVVGNAGAGRMVVSDGGTVSVGTEQQDGTYDGTIDVASQNGSIGKLIIGSEVNGQAIAAGTLEASKVKFGRGNGEIIFNHTSSDYVFDAAIEGAGTIQHLAGTTALTGDNSDFTGTTNVQGGDLSVKGTLAGTTNVTGGNLNVSGHLNGPLDIAGGHVAVTNGGSVTTSQSISIGGANNAFLPTAGVLKIADGGTVSVRADQPDGVDHSTVNIAGEDGFTGRLVIGGDKTEQATAAGTLEASRVKFGDGDGEIVFNHNTSDYDFSAAINGGGIINHTKGTTTLRGDSSGFTGTTHLLGGSLAVKGRLAGFTNVNGGDLHVTGALDGPLNIASGVVSLTDNGSISTSGPIRISSASNSDAANAALVLGASGIPAAAGYVNAAGGVELSGPGAAIVFNHTGDHYRFDTNVSGTGNINHLAGTTILSGDNEQFSGNTDILGGTLAVTERLGGSITVGAEGTLAGSGTVGTTTIKEGGILSPGLFTSRSNLPRISSSNLQNEIGTLTVQGNLTFASGSTYAVDLSSASEAPNSDMAQTSTRLSKSDRLLVNGQVTINDGATVRITALDDETSYKTAKRYQIISALDGTLAGQFSEIDNSNSPFLKFTTSYDDHNSYLTVRSTDFVSVAQTGNQRSLGAALDSLEQSGTSLALYNDLLMLEEGEALETYEELSGEVHATAQGAFTQTNRAVNTALNSRVRAVTDGVAAPSSMALGYAEEEKSGLKDDRFASYEKAESFDGDRFATWINAFGSWGKVDGTDGSSDTDVSNGGVLVGGDVGFGNDTRVGVIGGYSRSFFDAASSNGDSTNYHVGTYVGTKVGTVSLRSGANYTWHDVSTSRSVTALGQQLNGEYDASSFNIYGELAYRFEMGKSALEPFAALAYNRTTTDAFTETGGNAALSVDSSTMNTTYTTVGLRASSDFELGGIASVARGTVGWLHAFGDVDPVSTARFATGDSFSTSSTPIDQNAALLEAGIDFTVTPASTFSLTYSGQIGSSAYDHGANAKFRVKF